MIESIGDYENWRDSLQDRPPPDPAGPDERVIRYYSHDYTADTRLEYTRTGNRAELTLSFSSEDPDMGTEEMIYAGENDESMAELASDLRSEISAWLDAQDTSSFREQQGLSPKNGIHSQDDYFGEYSRTALYAFEGMLRDIEHDERKIAWQPADPEKKDWMYSASADIDCEKACIGHLRGDFGQSGKEFWTSWFDHQPQLKNSAFQAELQDVVNDLRREGGLLHSFTDMRSKSREGLPCEDSFGFQGETRNRLYFLRCTPRKGDYNFYLYTYDGNVLRELEKEKTAGALQPAKPKLKRNEMER